jgi:hypothetical protein
MRVDDNDSLFFLSGTSASRELFRSTFLGCRSGSWDDIIVVVGGPGGRIVLHRNDCGHDRRGIFPAGTTPGAASVRSNVEDPDVWEGGARGPGVPVLWSTQEAPWGRFVVVADPDGRPMALAKMKTI